MGPSDKAFSQVKNILGKLDRNIDQVRSKRLHPEPAAAVPTQGVYGPETLIGVRETLGPETLIGAPKMSPAKPAVTPVPGHAAQPGYPAQPGHSAQPGYSAPSATPGTPRSAFGRAKPLISDPPSANGFWKST